MPRPWRRGQSGVETAALVNYLPVSRYGTSRFIELTGDGAGRSPARPADYRVVTSTYFRAMGIPLLHGTLFDDHAVAGRGPVQCLVNL